jgi:hypothetical protein
LGERLAAEALQQGAGRRSWVVLTENQPAMRFYKGLGGCPDPIWQPWTLDAAGLQRLAGDS